MTRETPCTVSVVIPVLDDADRLDICLSALDAQTYPSDAVEVLVVDNGSSDGVEEIVRRHPGVRLLREPEPGSYAARNLGVRSASGDVIAFTDADCVPDEYWLECGVSGLCDSGEGHVLAGGVEVFAHDAARPTGVEVFELVQAFPQELYVTERHFGATANLFTTREVFDRVGLFGQDITAGGDMEWGNRAHALGMAIVFDPSAVVRHPARRTWKEMYLKLLRVYRGAIERTGSTSDMAYWRNALPPLRSVWRRAGGSRLPTRSLRMRYVAVAIAMRYVGLLARVRAERSRPVIMSRNRDGAGERSAG